MQINEIIDRYCAKGFGTMNKNDFEVWIFNQILHKQFTDTQNIDISSDYALSLFLKISETKVKRLRYEASLKYPEKPDYAELFIKYAASAKYDKPAKNMVTMQIKDIAFRKYLEAKLTDMNRFSDSSFNSDLIKISKSDFIELFDKVCLSTAERDEVIRKMRDNSDDTTSDRAKEIGKEAIKTLLHAVAGTAGDKITEYIADSFLERLTAR